jgi:hypothetical protein
MTTANRSYSELSRFDTFDDRFTYLTLTGTIGRATFGFDRWINQEFYRSSQWKRVREYVLVRDGGCDLGIPGMEIFEAPHVHHMNPMTNDDIVHAEEWILDPEFLITTSLQTHNDIHYGNRSTKPKLPLERTQGDTKLW